MKRFKPKHFKHRTSAYTSIIIHKNVRSTSKTYCTLYTSSFRSSPPPSRRVANYKISTRTIVSNLQVRKRSKFLRSNNLPILQLLLSDNVHKYRQLVKFVISQTRQLQATLLYHYFIQTYNSQISYLLKKRLLHNSGQFEQISATRDSTFLMLVDIDSFENHCRESRRDRLRSSSKADSQESTILG